MNTPEITTAQWVALVTSVVGLFISQGAITNHTGKLIVGLASIAVPMILALGDAFIRHGRAQAHAAIEIAKVNGRRSA